jgi:hypothetical protein
VPVCERYGELRSQVPKVQALLHRHRNADPEAWSLLLRDLERAIRSREYVPCDY